MKKLTTNLILLLAFSFSILSSCTKTEVRQDVLADDEDDIYVNDAKHPGHHQDHNHHNDCWHCPSTVATSSDISFSLDFLDLQQVGVAVDVFYTNPGPQGTFRVTLFTADGNIDSTVVITADHIAAGQTGTVHVDFWVPYDSFPLTLRVTGRPANLDCDIRSRREYIINNDTNRR